MSIFRLTACKTLVLLSLISVVGFSQSGRMMGVLPFHNEGNSRNDWVSRGIDEVLYNKLSEINSLSVYERETFRRILKSADVDVSNGVDARKAFSVGKSTGIEVLITGKYKVESDNLSLTFQMINTYTWASFYDETFTGPLSDIFLFLQKGIQKGIDIMQVSISPEEMRAQREDIIQKLSAGLISPVDAMQIMNPDLDPIEAKQELERIRAERAQYSI